jgi:hypothetical protein
MTDVTDLCFCPRCGRSHRKLGEPPSARGIRKRCAAMLDKLATDRMLRQGSPVDDLLNFVIAERGRAVEPRFEQALPLCLYFATEQDRDEFLAVFRELKPTMMTRKVP